ncbi:hypothetical protein [Luteimonas sp. R10]|nr:hypothetical protein U3649_15925 [Luteimonas sp. R10]
MMLHVVKLIERRFPGHGRAIVIALLLASMLALLAGTLLLSAPGGA